MPQYPLALTKCGKGWTASGTLGQDSARENPVLLFLGAGRRWAGQTAGETALRAPSPALLLAARVTT